MLDTNIIQEFKFKDENNPVKTVKITDSVLGRIFYYINAIFGFTIVFSKKHSKVILTLRLFLGYFVNPW
jgi:hypothetical protein